MKRFKGFECGMGIGGWLTNYKRHHVLNDEQKRVLTVGVTPTAFISIG